MPTPKGTGAASHVSKAMIALKKEIVDDIAVKADREELAKKFDARQLARSFTREAIETLAEIMLNKGASDESRINAAKALLDRGHGKAPVMVEDKEGVRMPVVFLPVELNEENRTITVQAERTNVVMPPTKQWHESKDTDPTDERMAPPPRTTD